jgi:hypothetical protein
MSMQMAEKLLARRTKLLDEAWATFPTAEEAVIVLNDIDDIANVVPFTESEVNAHFDHLDQMYMEGGRNELAI